MGGVLALGRPDKLMLLIQLTLKPNNTLTGSLILQAKVLVANHIMYTCFFIRNMSIRNMRLKLSKIKKRNI